MKVPAALRWTFVLVMTVVWLVPLMLTPAHAVTYAKVRQCNEVKCAKKLILEAQHTIRWFHMHDRSTLSARTSDRQQRWHRVAAAIIRDHEWVIQVERAKIARLTAAEEPAHLSLWRCIAGYPGARSDGRTGESGGWTGASNGSHFNVLQMTAPWGEGSYYVHDPRGMSALEIMQAAERGYVANGYSRGWLIGQWGQTVGPCLGYA